MAEEKSIQDLEQELENVEKDLKEDKWDAGFMDVLRQYRGEDEVVSFKAYMKDLEEKMEDTPRVPSGYKKLDDMLSGFAGGEVIVITAPTGEGKTTFCQNLTLNLLESETKSLWFSYELTPGEFIKKFGVNVPEGYLPKTLLSREMVWLERKIVEGIAKHGTRAVFIDHLHYLFNMAESRNPSMEIGNIMRNLKTFARKYNITMFVVAHTTKIEHEGRVGLESIRDSSFIGQESDFVIALWRIRERQKKSEMRDEGIKFRDEMMISLVKNRPFGRLGSFRLYYNNDKLYESIEEVPVFDDEEDVSAISDSPQKDEGVEKRTPYQDD